MTDEEVKAQWCAITDSVEMLRTILQHENFLGYDPYYGDLREALLNAADRIVREADRSAEK